MATETVKSTAITNLDAVPPVRSTAGKGAADFTRQIDATVAVASGVTLGSIYRMVRVPSNCTVKKVEAWLDAASTTITHDIGIYYSDAPNDGTKTAGTVINADHFGSAVALAAIVTPTEYTFEATTYLGADTRLDLWNTAQSGLTGDPGGFFDICFTSTATAGAAAVLNMRVTYTTPTS